MIIWFILFSSLFACEDPCPNVQRGRDFGDQSVQMWIDSATISPLWKGFASYHDTNNEDHYISFVADKTNVLVGEGDCELKDVRWSLLKWENVSEGEFKEIAFYESYYGVSPIVSMIKAIYGDKIIYLFNYSPSQKEWLFRLFTKDGQGNSSSIGGAYARPINPN